MKVTEIERMTAWIGCCAFLMLTIGVHAQDAKSVPMYVDAKAIKDRFPSITAEDMDMLRSKKILFGSRSFGMNTLGGLKELAKQDKKYDLMSSFQDFNPTKVNDDLSIIPADIFTKVNFVHFIVSGWPLNKRVDQMDELLGKAPHNFGKTVDVVFLYCEDYNPEVFDYYSKKMDAMQAEYPNIKFIYACSGFHGVIADVKNNERAQAFSEKVRESYMGKVPLFDMGKILSDDFRVGHVFCPEYSHDPTGGHPNLPLGETTLAKGFLLVLRDALRPPSALKQ
jgi:hypothetical protein